MKKHLFILVSVLISLSGLAQQFSYSFKNTPLSEAIVKISKDHPEIPISFIYQELDHYETSANVKSDNLLNVFRKIVGFNPVSVIKKGDSYYIEALQHGKYIYSGTVIGTDHQPVESATVLLLSDRDSTVLTYGMTDEAGRFSIPCDKRDIIGKVSCLGYKTISRPFESFSVGTIILPKTAYALNEIKVDGEKAFLYSDKSVYIPTGRQKNASQTAEELLFHMAIPQLEVNPMTNTVTTSSGSEVAIYIDNVEASKGDLSGIRTEDVRRVEFFIHPNDPRFHNAPYVVNFVMQSYEWGGYTKLSGRQSFGSEQSTGTIYSKFAYKSMIFDVYANDDYRNGRHFGEETREVFNFPEENKPVVRKTVPLKNHLKENLADLTFRAIYSNEKVQVTNMFQFNRSDVPGTTTSQSVSYENFSIASAESRHFSKRRGTDLYYNGEAMVLLNNSLALDVETAWRYDRNTSDAAYELEDLKILNNAVETTKYFKITPSLQWSINDRNTLTPVLHGEFTDAKVDYSGSSSSRQTYKVAGFLAGAFYQYSHENWTAGTMFTWVWGLTDFSGYKNNCSYPLGNIFGTYSPDKKNQFEVRWAFQKNIPETYQKSPTMLRQDELMWYAGTPDLKDYWRNQFRLSYTFLPTKNYQLTADFSYYRASDRVVTRYLPEGPDGTMVRFYVNNGDFNSTMAGLNFVARFFKGSLVAKVRPQLWLRHTVGEYEMTRRELTSSFMLTWYFGKFNLSGYYMTPNSYPSEDNGILTKSFSSYQVSAGWGDGPWKASVVANNFLKTDWVSSRETLTSNFYSFDRTCFGASGHWSVRLAVSYTFGYGKKVERGNEVSGSTVPGSLILK